MDRNGSRTHEPDLRELTAQLDGLERWIESELRGMREFLIEKIDGLAERTKQAADSSHLAITKAEVSRTEWERTHNDLQRQLLSQAEKMLTVERSDERFAVVDKRLADMAQGISKELQYLRDNQCEDTGKEVQRERGTDMAKWVVAQAIVVIVAVAGLVLSVLLKGM